MDSQSQMLFGKVKVFLENTYQKQEINQYLLKTLALLVTGMIFGPQVQLFAVALILPLTEKLPGIVKRFKRLMIDERVLPLS